jgi:hypothetical protein
MTVPTDAILAFHNAFRKDIAGIDAAALAMARGDAGYESQLKRFQFFDEVLDWHAKGEELAVFPALETVAPDVAEPYIRDHRGLEESAEAFKTAMAVHDALEAARATAAFRFHHDIHLAKEDAHLYRLFRERIPMPEQSKALGLMASTVPQERFPEVVTWMFPLIGDDDRENMTRIWQMVLPAPAFGGLLPLIKQATGDGWAELIRRIPGLEAG